jgi:hypothetical protein
MILDPKDKKVLSDTRMEKAKEFLADAQAPIMRRDTELLLTGRTTLH